MGWVKFDDVCWFLCHLILYTCTHTTTNKPKQHAPAHELTESARAVVPLFFCLCLFFCFLFLLLLLAEADGEDAAVGVAEALGKEDLCGVDGCPADAGGVEWMRHVYVYNVTVWGWWQILNDGRWLVV